MRSTWRRPVMSRSIHEMARGTPSGSRIADAVTETSINRPFSCTRRRSKGSIRAPPERRATVSTSSSMSSGAVIAASGCPIISWAS